MKDKKNSGLQLARFDGKSFSFQHVVFKCSYDQGSNENTFHF